MFGIVGICPVVLLEDEGFDALAGEVIRYIDEVYPDKHFTFKVNARRARKNYPLESMEINAQMGERILAAFPETSVDVHKPQVMFNIEIRNPVSYTHLPSLQYLRKSLKWMRMRRCSYRFPYRREPSGHNSVSR